MAQTVLTGFLFGLSIGLPFGPVSLLIVMNGMRAGSEAALATALGATTCGFAIAVAVILFATSLSGLLEAWFGPVTLISAAVLAVFGVLTICRPAPSPTDVPPPTRRFWLDGFLLSISNPVAVLPFIAFANVVAVGAGENSVVLAVGVALGEFTWYCVLVAIARALRGPLAGLAPALRVASGSLLLVFAANAALSVA